MNNVRELFDKKFGFGLMRLPELEPGVVDENQVCEMVDYYLKQGFKYFDTAYVYHNQQSESIIGRCLVDRYDRESFYLATKMPVFMVNEPADFDELFNTQLKRCGVDYFDLYLLHALNADSYKKVEELDGFGYTAKLKKEGKVKYAGFSFHDTAEVLDEILTKHPEVDFVQLQINYYDWEKDNVQSKRCYEVATRHNIPVIVMEPIKGGNLTSVPKKALEEISNRYENSPASLAVRYVASLDNVMMVLSGMSNLEQMKENTSFMKEFKPLEDEDYKVIEDVVKIIDSVETIPCTACKYCVDDCPKRINIPGIFATYNDSQKFKDGSPDLRSFNMRTKDGGKPADCIKCGKCESHCPQHIAIRDELVKMAEFFK